jgi:hypothetical protein
VLVYQSKLVVLQVVLPWAVTTVKDQLNNQTRVEAVNASPMVGQKQRVNKVAGQRGYILITAKTRIKLNCNESINARYLHAILICSRADSCLNHVSVSDRQRLTS